MPQFLPPKVTNDTPPMPSTAFKVPTPHERGIPVLSANLTDAAKWGYRRLFDGSDFKTAFDRFSIFFAATFARATATEDEELHNFLVKLLDGDSFSIHTETVSSIPIRWIEYKTGMFRLVVFPGTTDFRAWASYVQAIMVASPDGPTGVSMYYGVKDILHAHLTAFQTFYASEIADNFPRFALVGHSIGGAVATHIATQIDRAAPDTGSRPFNSIMSAYSFGAPAFQFIPPDVDFVAPKVRTIRTVNPGDPVPDLTQQAISFTNGVALQIGGPLFNPPNHYALRSWTINSKVPRRVGFWDKLDALRKGAISAVHQTFDIHRMPAYCTALERACKDFNDTPYPGFSVVVDANRRLAAMGK